MDVERMQAKREELQAQLTAFVDQANRQIAALEGAIRMLDELLAEVETEDGDDEQG